MKRRTPPIPLALAHLPQIDSSLLEQLFDTVADVAFFIKDVEGRYLVVNESLVRRHGLHSKTEVIGKRPSDICPGEFGRTPTEQDAKVLRSGQPLIEHLELHWAVPNEQVWCLTTKLPIMDAAGCISGLIGFSRDVRTQVAPQEIPSSLATALEEFEHDLCPDVTAMWLARRAGVTLQRLTRLTKRLLGLTPGQLIARIRINAACRMLHHSHLSIIEISLACGFQSHSAFTRSFRYATGVTPTHFRELRPAPP